MNFVTILLLLAAVAMAAVDAYLPYRPGQRPRPGPHTLPDFPHTPPFNPHTRFARSPHNRPPVTLPPDPNGHVEAKIVRGDGKSKWKVESQYKLYENKYGDIHVTGGANKRPPYKPQGEARVEGTFHFPG